MKVVKAPAKSGEEPGDEPRHGVSATADADPGAAPDRGADAQSSAGADSEAAVCGCPEPAYPSRRALLKALPLGALAVLLEGGGATRRLLLEQALEIPDLFAHLDPPADEGSFGAAAETDLHKIHHFDRTYPDDFHLGTERLPLLASTAARLERAMRFIGHGHFNLVSFDDLLRYAERYKAIGAFPRAELDFLEEIFYADASRYGFYGRKVIDRQTAEFKDRDVEKIPATGHYLLRGEPLDKYRRIRADLGEGVYLTSGVRGVVKQYQLFLSKSVRTGGNLSQASRSLAPPGYSYHAIGDFDVGRVGFGEKNFTADFAETPEYKRLIDLGYVAIRYTESNPYGVRHEPWHIKIV